MARHRRRIPLELEGEVLFLADHTCCICRVRGKDVQIHHIDRNSSHNTFGNLAVVCLDCHSRLTGTRGLGKSYKPGEVRKYKRTWEQQVLSSRRVQRSVVRYQKELISQIDLIVCETLAVCKNNARTKELLGILYELHLWRGNRQINKKIVEGLHHLALMSGLGEPRLAVMVAEKLWEMCWHFVGPKDVPMDKHDLAMLIDCLDALETLIAFNCEFGHGRKAAQAIPEQMENFFEVGLWYSNRRISNAVIRMYRKALLACYTDGKLEFGFGQAQLRRSLRRVRTILTEEKRDRGSELRRIDQLLAI